ncbi:hypothetical protein ACVIW2_004227 [Bradyrhizobium huanghuaihaiense]|jgi:hypothetical protein|uniref:Uncharacterized protein n=2 Tax=Bradyrhizobium TaxID=374 RepID=A0A7Z0QDB8_9BRAD|nr:MULTISPECIES: hypothetical protein [Bradyrhizobium]MBP1059210.1 hypothetical protein [Bradyrhizobium japonicum]MBP1090037.1 hypothetical protein [Bradyrhizobium japonicum]MCD9298419.1 hypothetical protein [Bradyrhizobium diazoefficiens]MCD9815793.1 hypothetical protein [Bradyrhizobium diazoefficiens]MCD9824079.1 hypothetical protein [Bradyrhizobium japonicum]
MRKRQDVDAELKAFANRTKQLRELRVRLLGELVVPERRPANKKAQP